MTPLHTHKHTVLQSERMITKIMDFYSAHLGCMCVCIMQIHMYVCVCEQAGMSLNKQQQATSGLLPGGSLLKR